jgi:hypothetical protein
MEADPRIAILQEIGKWLGGGSLGLILLGIIAYFTKRYEFKHKDTETTTTEVGGSMIQSLLADHFASERLMTEIRRGVDAIEAMTNAINRLCDRIDMVSLLDKMRNPDKK